jgi:hypothetical protein
LIREAVADKQSRQIIKQALQSYLWRGQVAAAKRYLTKLSQDQEDGIGNIKITDEKAWEALKRYLNVRSSIIPNYQARKKRQESIANRCVEQFNNLSISARCKRPNVRWTRDGVAAIAALATIAHNGESEQWWQTGRLPQWSQLTAQAAA